MKKAARVATDINHRYPRSIYKKLFIVSLAADSCHRALPAQPLTKRHLTRLGN